MMLLNLDRHIYEKEVTRSEKPTLLCFFKNTLAHSQLIALTEELSRQFESVNFYAVQEEDHEFFFGEYHFLGTPLFIFLCNGVERGRLFGSVPTDLLRAFIESNIRELQDQGNKPSR